MNRLIRGSIVIVGVFCWSLLPGQAAELKVFFGNLHSHTSYSDGSGTPDEAYRYARDRAKLDFLAITEHNHKGAEAGAADRRDGRLIATDPALYNGPQSSSLVKTANRLTRDGKFVAIYGQEFSTISSGNHANVFEVDQVIDETVVPNGKFDKLVQWLDTRTDSSGARPILQFNHPSSSLRKKSLGYGRDDFGGSEAEWIRKMGAYARLIEIRNGPGTKKGIGLKSDGRGEADYFYYLNQGFKLAPSGNQDNHYKSWGLLTDIRTGVISDTLTKAKLLEAIRSRHVYATEDKNLRVIFRVEGHLCGDVVTSMPPAGTELNIEYSIVDDDEPDAEYEIEVLLDRVGGTEAQVVEKIEIHGNSTGTNTITGVDAPGDGFYLFFRITQLGEDTDNEQAWTAPVWFEASVAPAITSLTPVANEGELYASKRSAIYHVSKDCVSAKAIKPDNLLQGNEAKSGRTQHEGCPIN